MLARYLRGSWCFVECQTSNFGVTPAKNHECGSELILRKDLRNHGKMSLTRIRKSGIPIEGCFC
jgi:hypothetical protein